MSSRRVGSFWSIGVPAIEILLYIEIVIIFPQDTGSIIRINAVHVFPGVMLLSKSIPLYLELEVILCRTLLDIDLVVLGPF